MKQRTVKEMTDVRAEGGYIKPKLVEAVLKRNSVLVSEGGAQLLFIKEPREKVIYETQPEGPKAGNPPIFSIREGRWETVAKYDYTGKPITD